MSIETAFVTGAGSGMGREITKQLLEAGASVYATDIREDGLQSLASEMASAGNRLITRQLDVADSDAFKAAANEAIDAFGGVDAVFNNAGVSLTDPVDLMNDEDNRWLFDINYFAVVTGTQAFLSHMKARGKGHIVNISSIFGHIGVPTQASYCAAKHAVKGFNESLHYELADTGVSVHSVHPGGVDTAIVRYGRHKHNLDGETTVEEMDKTFSQHLMTPADKAARIILDGVAKGKFHILVGGDAKRMYRLQRLLPALWRWLFSRYAKKTASQQMAQ